jgi:hypothetical protein
MPGFVSFEIGLSLVIQRASHRKKAFQMQNLDAPMILLLAELEITG